MKNSSKIAVTIIIQKFKNLQQKNLKKKSMKIKI